jgi:hypothetical protein
MQPEPPEMIEKIVGILIPPACREEVLGDLHERYTSTGQYILEAIQVIPMVLLSRISRTADPQVLLVEALALFLSYMVGGWYQDRTLAFLYADGGSLKLALPCAMILLGIVLEDAYATPGKRSSLKALRGLIFGLGTACFGEAALSAMRSRLAMPGWLMFYGSVIALLAVSVVRILFPPITDRPLGAGGPAFWLKHASEPSVNASIVIAAIVVLGICIGRPSLGKFVVMAAVVLAVREWSRRS